MNHDSAASVAPQPVPARFEGRTTSRAVSGYPAPGPVVQVSVRRPHETVKMRSTAADGARADALDARGHE